MITQTLTGLFAARFALPFFAAWALALALGHFAVPFLYRLRFQQTEREEGLESHKKKTGTPTMGGIIFLIPMILVTLLMIPWENSATDYPPCGRELLAVLIPTAGFGLIGFIDDYLKVVRHHNLGLRAWQKAALQAVVTLLFAAYLHFAAGVPIDGMLVPFAGGYVLKLGFFSLPALLFIALATVNGTNLTDGVDGLCASVTVPVALFFAVIAVLTNGAGAPAAAAMTGALLGYLYYNFYPAKVFMGDTGSLAIGGFVIGITYALKMPLFIPIVGCIYAVEVISVILQVGYFKATHGKRLFRMAPVHHHFEKGGWSETRVVGAFSTVTILACILALLGYAPAIM